MLERNIKTYIVDCEERIIEVCSLECELEFNYEWETERGFISFEPLKSVDITLGGPNSLASPSCEYRFIEPDNFLLHIQDPNPSLLDRIRYRLARWVLPSRLPSRTLLSK